MYLISNKLENVDNTDIVNIELDDIEMFAEKSIYNDIILIYKLLIKLFKESNYIYDYIKKSYFNKKETGLENQDHENNEESINNNIENILVKEDNITAKYNENKNDEINIYCEECMDKIDNDDEAIILGAYTYCSNCKPKMSQIQKYNKDRKDNIETLDNSNENIVNNISDKKDENNKKNGPEKNKSEINIDNIYKEIKKYINYEYKLNEDIEDTILKKINEFHVNRTNKYNLMIELYNELINQNIDKPSKLSKYIKTNKNLDFINIFNDTKYRRLYKYKKFMYFKNG